MAEISQAPLRSFLEKLDSGFPEAKLTLAFEPVVSVSNWKNVLYQECLARLERDRASVCVAADFLPEIEKLGLMADLDMEVLHQLMLELRFHSEMAFAVNLSLESLTNDRVWLMLLQQLVELSSMGLAARVIFEITEQLPWIDLGLIADRVTTLRSFGCRVALDDFGAGLTPLSAVSSIQFDIIKIDRAVLKERRICTTGVSSLSNLVGFASCYCPDIVVEGVETEEEAEVARVAGAKWLQGYLFPVNYYGAV